MVADRIIRELEERAMHALPALESDRGESLLHDRAYYTLNEIPGR